MKRKLLLTMKLAGLASVLLIGILSIIGSTGDTPGNNSGTSVYSEATGELNDTGVLFFADATQTSLGSEPVSAPGQDASKGRDADTGLIKSGGGIAGFDFSKLDSNGQLLANQDVDYSTQPWACVLDNNTGLIWEVKTIDDGLNDWDNWFSWYNSDTSTNGGDAGYQESYLSYCNNLLASCDTETFVAAVNAASLCGYTDWRLPTVDELHSLSNYSLSPAIDGAYFPHGQSNSYWTNQTDWDADSTSAKYAMMIDFDAGYPTYGQKTSSYLVRLVRSDIPTPTVNP